MPNARDAAQPAIQKILMLGPAGSGKTSAIWTLPGRKFAYVFDPASVASLRGLDIDYEEFLPDTLELDASLRGFNKGSKDDKPLTKREPTTYVRWTEDLNKRHEEGYFKDVDWLCVDSLTLLANAVMDRIMFLNGRYGGIEDLSDFRVAGSKIAEVFRSICSLPLNLYCTGHVTSFQDDKTKRIETQINLPGKARQLLPLLFSNIWLASGSTEDKQMYSIRTRPEPRGFQHIRTTLQGLADVEDMTVKDWKNPERYGVGRLLSIAKPRTTQQPPAAPGAAAAKVATVAAPN